MLLNPLSLAFAPIKAVGGLARLLQQQAEEELYDPARAQRQLEELADAADAGLLTEDELEQAQQQIINRLIS